MRYWWSYLTGYLIVSAEGAKPERLVNLSMERGIELWDIRWSGSRRIVFRIRASDYFALRHIARSASCRVRIRSRRGYPFALGGLKRRRAFVAGIFFFLIALYMAGSFVWIVDASVPPESRYNSRESVLEQAAELGLHVGSWRPLLHANDLARELALHLPSVAWVGVHIKGTRAELEVVERTLPEKPAGAAHLVASKDGVVEEVIVYKGNSRIQVGDVVQKGQILVSGIITGSQGSELVRAEGEIRARVWYDAYASVPLQEHQDKGTGRSSKAYRLEAGSLRCRLWGPSQSPYANQVTELRAHSLPGWGRFRIPLSVITINYKEIQTEVVTRTVKQARELAGQMAQESLRAEIPSTATVLDWKLDPVYGKNSGEIMMRAAAETRENIATVYPLGLN